MFNLVTAGTIEDEVLRILDEKINMFELVVGEVGAILGEFEEQQDFSTLVLDAWLRTPDEARATAFAQIENQLLAARRQYDGAKAAGRRAVRERARCRLRSGRMQHFVADLLAQQGALVEFIEPEGLEVLASPPVQQALGVNELSRLGFGATLPAGAAARRDRERLARSVRPPARPTWSLRARSCCDSDARAPSDPQRRAGARAGAGQRDVPAARRGAGLDPLCGPGLPLFRRVRREARRRAAARREPGDRRVARRGVGADAAPAGLRRRSRTAALPAEAELPPDWQRDRLLELVDRALRPRLDAALDPFVKVLRRRLGRDQERLYAYHNDLHREAARRLSLLAEGDAGRPREEQRQEAIRREYHAKLDDLSRQYAMRVTVEWVQTLELVMPVQRFAVQIRRRKAERVIHLDWNPLARRLESPACEFSGSAERPRLVCDDALHLVTAEGLAPCAGCGRAFCRACHRERCPRCQR